MKRRFGRDPERGTSLVEALVALAVMAFGMLAVVGIQSTLRLYADVAKQRSEAVRIGQEAIEGARAFSEIDTLGGRVAYADIVTTADVAVAGYTTNTAFTLTQSVQTRMAPDRKELRVRVDWTDRAGQAQRVELNSLVGANDPRVSRALGAQPKGIPLRQPGGRHAAIPPGAKGLSGGLSAFKPDLAGGGSGTVVWVFNNLSGIIVGLCDGVATSQDLLSDADITSCSDNTTAHFLSGYVRFSTALWQPGAAQAENPESTALNLAVAINLTSTGHPAPTSHVCFAAAPTSTLEAAASTAVAYYCAIFANSLGLWSGTSTLTPLGFSDTGNIAWTIALNAADASASAYRVCRYTTAASDTAPNRQHPRTYTDVATKEPLVNQNFLVIRAGDGVTTPFVCPSDVAANPAAGDFVNSNTRAHQPWP